MRPGEALAYISASRPGEERTRSLSAAWSENHANGRFSRGYAWDSLRRLVLPDPDAAAAGPDRARRRRGERPRRAEQRRVALSHRRRRDRGHCHVHDHYQRWVFSGGEQHWIDVDAGVAAIRADGTSQTALSRSLARALSRCCVTDRPRHRLIGHEKPAEGLPGPRPSIRPPNPIDRMHAAVVSALRRQAAVERRALRAAPTSVNGKSEK